MYEIDGYTKGRALAWAFRWHTFSKPGKFLVHIASSDGDFGILADAVIDDFGNLVRVQ